MKTKFKNFLLYSLACVGAVSLFLSAYQPQQSTSNVPESHVWELAVNPKDGRVYTINKQTGETRNHATEFHKLDGYTVGFEYWTAQKLEYGEHRKK